MQQVNGRDCEAAPPIIMKILSLNCLRVPELLEA